MSDEVAVDRDRCMGSGQCTFYAPSTFDLDDDGIAEVIEQHGDIEEKIRMAIDVCPTRAIKRITEGAL